MKTVIHQKVSVLLTYWHLYVDFIYWCEVASRPVSSSEPAKSFLIFFYFWGNYAFISMKSIMSFFWRMPPSSKLEVWRKTETHIVPIFSSLFPAYLYSAVCLLFFFVLPHVHLLFLITCFASTNFLHQK